MARSQPPLPDVEGVTHRDVDAAGLRVHVAEAGSGPPVVMLHGWPQHWWAWRDVIGLVAPQRRVICPDLRGMGWTEAPDHGYAKHQLAEDLIATLDALGLDRVALVGHDWGGWTSLLAAAHHPERFTEVLALGIPHPWVQTTRPTLQSLRQAATILGYQVPMSTPGLGAGLQRSGIVRVVLRTARAEGEFTREELDCFDATYRVPQRARAGSRLYRTFLTQELPKLMRHRYEDAIIRVPVRMVLGSEDPVAQGPVEDHGGHIPDFALERLEGVGHFIPEERPQLVAERVLAMAV